MNAVGPDQAIKERCWFRPSNYKQKTKHKPRSSQTVNCGERGLLFLFLISFFIFFFYFLFLFPFFISFFYFLFLFPFFPLPQPSLSIGFFTFPFSLFPSRSFPFLLLSAIFKKLLHQLATLLFKHARCHRGLRVKSLRSIESVAAFYVFSTVDDA